MKKVGLIGGMSWESTTLYYQWINREIQKRIGGLHSAKIVLSSVDFSEIALMQREGRWEDAGKMLSDEAVAVERAGVDCIVLCTNTMHKLTEEIEAHISVPFLHIADATGEAILENKIHKVALLGTAFTMEQSFYKSRLEAMGITVIVPREADREVVHHIIYQELCRGIILEESQEKYCAIIDRLIADGAEGVIFGCTEITMLIGDIDFPVPTFDTTLLHAMKAVDFALA